MFTRLDVIKAFSPFSLYPLADLVGPATDIINGYNGIDIGTPVRGIPGGELSATMFKDDDSGIKIDPLTGFNSAFGRDEGAVTLEFRVNNEAVWAERSTNEFAWLFHCKVDSNNYVRVILLDDPNKIQFTYEYNGNAASRQVVLGPSVGWINLGMAWSKSAGRIGYFVNGKLDGNYQTHIGDSFSASSLIYATIGCEHPGAMPRNTAKVAMKNLAFYDYELNEAEMSVIGS